MRKLFGRPPMRAFIVVAASAVVIVGTVYACQPPWFTKVDANDSGIDTLKLTTQVGGIIHSDTTWTEENSPYLITNTVQIPSEVTLTIEPGVSVTMLTSGDMFLLNGTILADGTNSKKIIFDGGDNSNFFSAKNSSPSTFLDLDYCILKDGLSFWPPTGYAQYGYFNLRHSEVTNLTGYSHIWYPEQDIHIEYNKFVTAGGFSTVHDGSVKVYIRYNLFDTKNSGLPSHADSWISNYASYESSETIVKYNSFINTEGTALQLPGGYDNSAMSATENYWGTQDTDVIDAMIYDKNDDITSAGYINYLPILTEPHPDTPTLDHAGRKGDFDGDGDIDLVDFFLFAAAYGSERGDDNYNPAGDFDDDGVINLYDFFLFAAVYGT